MRVIDELSIAFNELKLGVFAEKYQEIWDKCVADKLDYKEYLKMLVSMELEGRHHRRIKRLLKQANIPRKQPRLNPKTENQKSTFQHTQNQTPT